MRTPLIIVAIVTISATACGQALPMWPSPASVPVSPASAPGGLVSPRTPTPPPIEPLLARLNLVTNHVVSANHQLDLYLQPQPPPITPPSPIHLRNALDFYLKANDVLGAISMPVPPPIVPEWTDALSGIIGQANMTLSLLHGDCDACGPDGPPIFQDLIAQANQTKSLATALQPEPPPI